MNPTARQRIVRLWWLAVLTVHGFWAVAWWWLMPGGFPVDHPRFWANRAAPAALMVVVLAALTARTKRRERVLAAILLVIVGMWLGLAIGLIVTSPISGWIVGSIAFLCFAMLAAGWIRSCRHALRPVAAVVIVLLAGALAGLLPLTQHAGPPSTRPLNVTLLHGANTARQVQDVWAVRLRSQLMVQPADGVVSVGIGRVNMTIQPLLTFISRSPDGFWSNLNPHRQRWNGPPHELARHWSIPSGVAFNYVDPSTGESSLSVIADDPDSPAATIESITRLDEPVYSHLNTFTELGIYGHRSLAIEFSPCPGVRIDVLPSDYPVGRPARCAYMDGSGNFRVVEASSGEKGPFKPLATGRLARGDPLAITLYDADAPLCRITLVDFSAQAGAARSPTAGWGLPVNAIEFSRYGDSPTSPVGITVTLAGTSVGRGWDTVGHAAGTYRNRVRFEPLTEPATRPAE